MTQLGMLGTGIVEEFNWVYAFLALVPFLFFAKLHRRERAWMIGVAAIYLCLGVLLLILLNPPPDRQAQGLVRVFFTASHTMIALLVGYGLTLIAAYMATHYQRFRYWGLIGGGVAIALALFSFAELNTEVYFGPGAKIDLSALMSMVGKVLSNKDQYRIAGFWRPPASRHGRIICGRVVCLSKACAPGHYPRNFRVNAPLLGDDPLVGQRAT